MNFDESLSDTIAQKYFLLLARRASVKAQIDGLIAQIAELALLLDALQQHRRSKYTENVARAFGITPAAAANEQRNLRAMAKRPLSKSFFELNGLLPAPPRKTPKASKPASTIGKAGQLTAELIRAKERGLNAQEKVILTDMLDKLMKELEQ